MSAEPIEDPSDPIRHHRGAWTERDYFALGEDVGPRIELIDGGLLLTPAGDNAHQRIAFRVAMQLDQGLPPDFDVVHEGNVRLAAGRILIPDVVVSRSPLQGLAARAEDLVLVCEVVSPSSGPTDRLLKPVMYAEAGIPWYLRIEQRPVLELVLLQRRDEESYAELARARAGETLELPGLGCSIEVDALVRPRG